ncbi:MAG: hypothetical protein HY699_09790 [Deltaproteobacteria bacterium]|nr:hypothetical protein [Deltaproteobacteria bacterium]
MKYLLGSPLPLLSWLRLAAFALTLLASVAGAGVSGDADCNGYLDPADLDALIESSFGTYDCPDADINGDGSVGAADVAALLQLLSHPATPTPIASGPVVTFFGLASSAGEAALPIAITDDGVPIFWRPVGVGFKLVIEGAPGSSGKMVGRIVEPITGRPDLQLESDQGLGNGGYDRCPGTVPGISPPDFGPGPLIDAALRAFACGFQATTTRTTACTLGPFGNADWVGAATQVQFCLQVEALRQFPPGQTQLSVQLRDVDGNAGPVQHLVVLVGATPPPTNTRTPTPTATTVPTNTRTATRPHTATATPPPSRTLTATATPTGFATSTWTATATAVLTAPPTATKTRTATPSATGGTPPSTSTPTRTVTASPIRSATAPFTSTPTASPSRTTPLPSATRSATPTLAPSASATATRTATRPPTITPSRSPTPQPTPTRSVTRTPTRIPTSTPSPSEDAGPVVSFFGLANADYALATPTATTPEGIPIYQRAFGYSFVLVVEGRPGSSRQRVGGSSFNYDPTDPTVRPDLQIQVNRPLGNGSAAVCDNSLPTLGGIPAVDPPSFELTQPISDALNDLGCRFLNGAGTPGGRSQADACTVFIDGTYHFVDKNNSTIQFCGQIANRFAFPSGETLVTVRLRDQGKNLGPPAQLIIRY